jgi:uncharacterized protein DUF4291
MFPMPSAPYLEQERRWPASGRVVLASFDPSTIVVYQAFRPAIAEYAVRAQKLGGEFSLERMSWIKPNFLWMMHRSGWARKRDQEAVLAIRILRSAFDAIVAQAVPSSFDPARHADPAAWRAAVDSSDVRLQWDPDHAPDGTRRPRRAIQLGLRGDTLRRYATEWVVEIHDITAAVHAQHRHVAVGELASLVMPIEEVYPGVGDAHA